MDAVDRIKHIVSVHPVVLFMKGTPEFPMCRYSQVAAGMLDHSGMPFHAVNLLTDPELRASLPSYANWPTAPQLFVQGELIGGCDIMRDLDASGELARLLRDALANGMDTASETQRRAS